MQSGSFHGTTCHRLSRNSEITRPKTLDTETESEVELCSLSLDFPVLSDVLSLLGYI